MTGIPRVRRVLLLAALTALLSQAVFEFGPLWLVTLHVPAAAYGPYWALLVATLGAGGYLATRLPLDRRSSALAVAAILAVAPILLATSHSFVVVAAAQTRAAADAGRHRDSRGTPAARRRTVQHPGGRVVGCRHLLLGVVPAVLGWLRRSGPLSRGVLGRMGFRGRECDSRRVAGRVDPRRSEAPADATVDESLDDHTPKLTTPPPADLACRDLVRLVSDYVDGELPPDWRATIDDHLSACDGCTNYLQQIRQTIVLLEQIDANRHGPAENGVRKDKTFGSVPGCVINDQDGNQA